MSSRNKTYSGLEQEFVNSLTNYLIKDLVDYCLSYTEEEEVFVCSWNLELSNATHVAVSPRGEVYVAQNSKVLVFTAQGQKVTEWSLEHKNCYGLAISCEDKVYIADWNNDAVWVFSRLGTFLFEIGRSGPVNDRVYGRLDLIISPHNELYIMNTQRIQVYTLEGKHLKTRNNDGLVNPLVIAFSKEKVKESSSCTRLFTSDDSFLLMFDYPYYTREICVSLFLGYLYTTHTHLHQVTVFSIKDSKKEVRTLGNLGTNNGQFFSPGAIATFKDKIYVLDTGNNRIQVFVTVL